MAIVFGKGVKKVLNTIQAKIEARMELADGPKPQRSDLPTIVQWTTDPEESMLAALWALPGRVNRKLYMVRKIDGKRRQVMSYNPVTRVITLRNSINEASEVTFETKMTQDIEELYFPRWG